jgi:hypothetical protein
MEQDYAGGIRRNEEGMIYRYLGNMTAPPLIRRTWDMIL